MNYSHGSCGTGFTQGQKDRMKTVISTYLSNAIIPSACNPPLLVNEHNKYFEINFDYHNAQLQFSTQSTSQMSLYSINGATLIRRQLPEGNHQINLNHLPPGIYMVKINSSEYIYAKKIVKK